MSDFHTVYLTKENSKRCIEKLCGNLILGDHIWRSFEWYFSISGEQWESCYHTLTIKIPLTCWHSGFTLRFQSKVWYVKVLYGHPQEDEEKHVKVEGDQTEQNITILFLLHFSVSVNIHLLMAIFTHLCPFSSSAWLH